MVCPRRIRVAREELERLGFDVRNVKLGEATGTGDVTDEHVATMKGVLEDNGFELIQDKRVQGIEKIKHAVLKLVQNDYTKNPIPMKDSELIAREVGLDYHYISTLFSLIESITHEHLVQFS